MRPTLDDIFYAVLEAWDTDEETYRNIKDSRESLAVSIRQVFVWIAQEYEYSQPKIGTYLGMAACSVFHNKKMCKDYMSYDAEYLAIVNKALVILYEKENIQTETTIKGIITRDEDGDLTLWEELPKKYTPSNGMGIWYGASPRKINRAFFPQITWESEPQECEVIIKLKSYGGV